MRGVAARDISRAEDEWIGEFFGSKGASCCGAPRGRHSRSALSLAGFLRGSLGGVVVQVRAGEALGDEEEAAPPSAFPPGERAAVEGQQTAVQMEYFSHYSEDDAQAAAPAPLTDKDENAKAAATHGLRANGEEAAASEAPAFPVLSLNCAPPPKSGAAAVESEKKRRLLRPEDALVMTNPKASSLEAPLVGPLTPHQQRTGGFSVVYATRLGGRAEEAHVNPLAFDTQFRQFMSRGFAADPSDSVFASARAAAGGLGCESGAAGVSSQTARDLVGSEALALAADRRGFLPESGVSRKERKALRVRGNDDVESDEFQGPWRVYAPVLVSGEGGEAGAAASATAQGEAAGEAAETAAAPEEESRPDSVFYGKARTDYQGRSWLAAPTGVKPMGANDAFFPPKQCLHSFVGHTGAVQAIRLFPETAHLLLSASLDSTLRVWDVYNQRKCLRAYLAHRQAARDAQWANSQGARFYSCSYDNTVKLWDTESGSVVANFELKKTPYCVAVHPSDENCFVVGAGNKRAVQFDARSGQVVVEYSDHLAAVNTVTFCEEGRKLVTTADDKKMFVWEFGIPVVVRHIADPDMHSMPAACVHPSARWISLQSMANEIVTYEAQGKFRFVPRKRFRGHVCAGYAIKPGFSPDGKWLLSGDASGRLWVWNFRNGRNVRTLKAHDQVCVDVQWHPHFSSRVFTCGWDGLIKLWD